MLTRRLKVPQLIENYKQGSAEGISLLFLIVWFVGDITNLAGAVWSGLVPTVIALAVYFCFADFVLITQCLYYNIVNARRQRKFSQLSVYTDDSVEQPLLSRHNSSGRHSIGLPGSHRRQSSSASRRHRASFHRRESGIASIFEEDSSMKAWLKSTMSILAVCTAGTVGWAVAWKTGVWSPAIPEDDGGSTNMALGAQMLGYFSAFCYLGARIPQIVKNWKDRSCEGLSLLFFLLSLLGNLTYGAGVSVVFPKVGLTDTDIIRYYSIH
jgi:uncharacterized protein with PQ loop repeat